MKADHCTICRLPDDKRAAVEAAYKAASAALDVDGAVLDVANRYRVTRLALRRHYAHIGPIDAAPRSAHEVPSSPKLPSQGEPPKAGRHHADTSASRAAYGLPDPGGGTVVERARVLLAYLAVPGRSAQELAQAREIRASLIFEARLVGAMTTKAKLHEHPDWPAFLDELVTALGRVSGALDALDAYLARTGERSAAA